MIGLDLKRNPDYWVSFFYKRIMGLQALQVKLPFFQEKVRSYGHCGQKPGKIGLMFVNYGEKKLEIKLPFRCKHEIFHLQGRKGLHRLDFRKIIQDHYYFVVLTSGVAMTHSRD